MRNHRRRLLPLLAVLAVLVLAMSATAFAAGEDPHRGTRQQDDCVCGL